MKLDRPVGAPWRDASTWWPGLTEATSELDTRCQTAAAVARKAAFSDVGFRCCLDP